MRVAFIWQGFDGRYGKWKDGLWAAMQLLEQEHEVKYFDFREGKLETTISYDVGPPDCRLYLKIKNFNPDIVLYWEAPVTQRGKDADNWNAVCALPYKKCLLFAGGPLKAMDVKDFDLVFVESNINEEDCEREGIPYKRAFGVNTQIFRPLNLEKKHDGFMQATFAEWKRHQLFADALGPKGLVAGRKQEHDLNGYNHCVKRGVTILEEQPAEEVAKLINESVAVVNTSEYWGGGQRCTLEAMACGVPVVVMDDSPKNREFVEDSWGGIVCPSNAEAIRQAVETLKEKGPEFGKLGYEYVQKHWTEQHYAKSILEGILSIV